MAPEAFCTEVSYFGDAVIAKVSHKVYETLCY
jgi:hypothetical protein